MTENERKWKNKYREKVEELRVELYPTDADIKERINERIAAREPKATYIKRLIREDMQSDHEKLTRLLEKMYFSDDLPKSKEYQAFRDLCIVPMIETIEHNRKKDGADDEN